MTTTDPTTRPIHERFQVEGRLASSWTDLWVNGEPVGELDPAATESTLDLIAAAGKTHAVLVNLPDGSQVLTCSYPNGAVEASVRSSSDTRERWTPVDMLGGSVEVAP